MVLTNLEIRGLRRKPNFVHELVPRQNFPGHVAGLSFDFSLCPDYSCHVGNWLMRGQSGNFEVDNVWFENTKVEMGEKNPYIPLLNQRP